MLLHKFCQSKTLFLCPPIYDHFSTIMLGQVGVFESLLVNTPPVVLDQVFERSNFR